jgi:quercetin dioxygenase-like cupin family protein
MPEKEEGCEYKLEIASSPDFTGQTRVYEAISYNFFTPDCVFTPGEQLMMMEVHFEQGAEGYEHSHPHEQLSYCLKGSFEYFINGEKHLLRAGETISIPGGARHGTKALEDGALLDTSLRFAKIYLKGNKKRGGCPR